jgi:hypothetical protein
MAVFDLAETSSVLGILSRLCRLELCHSWAFGMCLWFHMKPSVSAAAGTVAGIGHCQH